MHTLLKLAQLRSTGHATRMPDERLPKKVFYEELQVGKRSKGGQKKRFKDTLKVSLKDSTYHLSPGNRVNRIRQRGVASSEREQMTTKQRESTKLNENATCAKPEPRNYLQSSFSELICSICNRQFRAKTWPNQPPENTPTHINYENKD